MSISHILSESFDLLRFGYTTGTKFHISRTIMIEKFLEGKLAVITGGSRGLGREMALSLADAGARIALVGRDEDKLAESKNLVSELGAFAEFFVADISKESEVINLRKEINAQMGKVDILINNAGTAVRKDVTAFNLEEWQQVLNTNLTGAFMMSKAFAVDMTESGWGRIINITSIMAHVGSEGRSAYCASKAGLLAFTKCMGLELANSGVNVVAISPGFYSTDLTAPLKADPQKNAALMAATPMRKWGNPKDIGKIALFICSDAADFITGTDILSDGGWLAQ